MHSTYNGDFGGILSNLPSPIYVKEDYSTKIKEELMRLQQDRGPIPKYKHKFDEHIINFSSLVKIDCVCIFVNGLHDQYIKYMVKVYNPKTIPIGW
jgi:hypothetical protein